MSGMNYFIFWNVSIINLIVSYLHFLISNITLLVFIRYRNRIGEGRGNNRTQEMNFVCLSDPPKKSKSQKSCHKFSKVLFTSLIIYFLLLTILFSSALISKYAVEQVSKEKRWHPLDRQLPGNLEKKLILGL